MPLGAFNDEMWSQLNLDILCEESERHEVIELYMTDGVREYSYIGAAVSGRCLDIQ